jgi:hypothetical protein
MPLFQMLLTRYANTPLCHNAKSQMLIAIMTNTIMTKAILKKANMSIGIMHNTIIPIGIMPNAIMLNGIMPSVMGPKYKSVTFYLLLLRNN